MLEEHLLRTNLYENNLDCVVSGNKVFEDPLTIEVVKELRFRELIPESGISWD